VKQRPTVRSLPNQRHARRAFSLLELSIVVIIISITATLGLELAGQFVARRAYAETQAKLAALDEAMVKFYQVYGRLPCPSIIPPTDADDGLESLVCNDNPIIQQDVMLGRVPFRTMNLQRSATIDGYGNRINYVVTRFLALDPTTRPAENFNNSDAKVEIRTGRLEQPCSANCTVLADPAAGNGAAYAIFSNGENARGAFNTQGVQLSFCYNAASDLRIDAQNCASALSPLTVFNTLSIWEHNAIFYDSRFNNGSQAENYFDDIIVWRTKARLM
jgi:prepilin-type N-terminal cleavage/methylation domain-containing protein